MNDEQQFIWLNMLFQSLNTKAYDDYVMKVGQKLSKDPKSFNEIQ